MKKPIKKIIIVGGGSAGWMSAAFLTKQFPDLEIALVESPDVPIVGVGESTLGTINQFLGFLGLTDKDWMHYCNATYKLAIKFSDFHEKGEAFYYPFGIKDMSNTKAGITDWYVKKVNNPDTPVNDFYESFYSVMPLIYQSKIYDNKDGQLPNFSWTNDSAYHMDAALFGEFLKNHYCVPRGVVHIAEHVEGFGLSEDGFIDYVQLRNGDQLEADLYLDCTGFKSLILEQTMGIKFHSFNSVLPNNKAWVTHIPYVDKEKEMENVTNCTAIENGWVWNIPLYNRIGSGYVFCDKFISDEEALEEYKRYLDGPNMKVPNSERSKNLEFRMINIKNGVHEKCWHKNVVAVGLSYGFIEPLESTGLLSVQEILLKLGETLCNKQINRFHIDNFNYIVNGIMHGFKYFVGYHYALSSRRDTQYWRYVTEEVCLDPSILGVDAYESSSQVGELAVKLLQTHDIPGDLSMGGIPDIFVGNNTMPVNSMQIAIFKNITKGRFGEEPDIINSSVYDYWNQKKEYINALAETAPSHYEYLKKEIYEGNE